MKKFNAHALQLAPAYPPKHEQVPSKSGLPWPLQVVDALNWHAGPLNPALHAQNPLPAMPWLHVPLPLHGFAAPPGHARHEVP